MVRTQGRQDKRMGLALAALLLTAAALAQTSGSTSTQTTGTQTTPAATPPAAAQTSDQPPPPPATPGGATHVMGFEGVKRNTKGTLTVADGKLKFDKSAIDISAIGDVFTGSESRQVGGTPLTLVKIAAPFGAGRALSLFAHQQVDNITVEYTDANGGLHGAIFILPKGQAEPLKKDLVSAGAHVSIPVVPEKAEAPKEKK